MSRRRYTSPGMEVLQTVPILRIFDVAKAKEFYLGYLGLRADWEHRFEPALPLYMLVSRDGCVLHLSEHYELNRKNYAYQRPGIELAPWNARVMQLTDPFGNRLRFNEDLK